MSAIEKTTNLTDATVDLCFGCPTFEKFKEKAIRESDSVFEAVTNTRDFCEKCYKICVKKVDK